MSDDREAYVRRGDAVGYWARRQPDTPAVISPTGNRTYGELDRRADRLLRDLRARGVGPGSAVAMMVTNRPAFVEVYTAAKRGGWTLTPINWHLTATEAAYIVDDCGARAFVGDTRAPGAAGAAPEGVVRLAVGGPIEGFEDYDTIVDDSALDGGEPVEATLGHLMLYTSGTTGHPKGVERPAEVGPADLLNLNDVQPGDVALVTGPLYHAAPLTFALTFQLQWGGTIVLMERWDPAEALRLVEAHSVTHAHFVPTMFHRLLALPEHVRAAADVSSLRAVHHGAAPCPVPVKRAMIEWLGPIVNEYYAATEGAGTTVDSETWLRKPGTVGRPVEGAVMVGDDDGAPVPTDEVGLVYLRAPEAGRFRYHGDDAKTEATYRDDWFTLGDMGYLDADGFLFLTDRSANLIISGGVNIYPAEIDAVLLTHAAVGDCATVGLPDDEWGESVVAVVEPKTGVQPTDALAADIREHARTRLAGFKVPRRVVFVDQVPRTDAGKVSRHLVRSQLRDDQLAHTDGGP